MYIHFLTNVNFFWCFSVNDWPFSCFCPPPTQALQGQRLDPSWRSKCWLVHHPLETTWCHCLPQQWTSMGSWEMRCQCLFNMIGFFLSAWCRMPWETYFSMAALKASAPADGPKTGFPSASTLIASLNAHSVVRKM